MIKPHDTLLVFKSHLLVSQLSQVLVNVDVLAFGASAFGRRYKLVVVCDPVDAKWRDWTDTVVKTRVASGGAYFEVTGDETTLPAPKTDRLAPAPGTDDGS